MRSRPSFALLATLAASLMGCGSSGEDTEPKRIVEARTEALRYFAPDTPFIAIADPSPGGASDPAGTYADLAAVAVVGDLSRRSFGYVAMQGIEPERLVSLLRTSEAQLESESAQVAAGGIPGGDLLLVLATERPKVTRLEIERITDETGMRPVGSFDDADLYRGDSAALSVRDGVVVLAPTLEEVTSALKRRDSDDRESRIDEGRVREGLEATAEDEPPLLAFADVGTLALSGDVARLAARPRLDWIGALGDAGLALDTGGGGEDVEIHFHTRLDAEQADRVPLGEEPADVALRPSDLPPSLSALGSGELTASATPDELRALLRLPDGG